MGVLLGALLLAFLASSVASILAWASGQREAARDALGIAFLTFTAAVVIFAIGLGQLFTLDPTAIDRTP